MSVFLEGMCECMRERERERERERLTRKRWVGYERGS